MSFARVARIFGLVAVFASVFLVLAPAAAAAGPTVAGLFFKTDATGTVFAAPTVSSDVDIAITGDIARVTVIQRFRNPAKVWLEGVYVYPLPERSAVDRLVMQIGDRRIEGRILEKAEAEKTYEAALAAGKRASLLSSARPNVFSTRIANIGPGEEITIEIGYQDQVPFSDGAWSYRFPLVVAPRYTPAASLPLVAVPPSHRSALPQSRLREIAQPATERARDGRDLFGPVRHPARGPINPVSLTVRIEAGVPIAEIAAATHAIDIDRPDARSARVFLSSGAVAADRDFVLNWRPESTDIPQVGLFAEDREGLAHLLVSLMPPDSARWPEQGMPRDLILVIDKSGSMHGPAIAGARRAAVLALERLASRDRFNLIAFDDSPRRLFDDVAPATQENLRRARAILAALESGGGTQMAGALEAALSGQAPAGRLRQVVFLTDGAVGNDRELTELIEARLGTTRLFTVGVGSAPNAFFMRRVAEVGRGTFTYIDRPEELVAKMAALHGKLERPALTDIRATWDLAGGAEPELFPTVIPDLYIGDPISFAARIDNVKSANLRGTLVITGRLGEKPWSTRVPLEGSREGRGVAAIWGRAKARSLRNAYPNRQPDWEATRDAVIETALAYQLVTEFTSLVAVDESQVVRPRDQRVESTEMERNLPAGMDFEKVFGSEAFGPRGMAPVPAPLLRETAFRQAIGIPATATPAPLLAMIGGVLLVAGILLIRFRRRVGART